MSFARIGLRQAFLGAIGLAAFGGVAATQQPPPVFQAGTELVNLVVTVHDNKGHLVSDLTPDDFVVYENGKPQPLVVFARSAQTNTEESLVLDAGLLLDTSESMKRTLDLAQEAAVRFLDSIPRARNLIAIFFDHDIRVSRYDSEQQQGLFARILETQSAGGTALYDAITVYLSRIADTSGRKVLIVLSDGEDSISKITRGELRDVIRSSPVTIYSIWFAESLSSTAQGPARAFMYSLAEMTGGKLFAPQSSEGLGKVLDEIIGELRAQYVLGFAPSLDGGSKFRKLRVELKKPGLDVRHRPGYFAQ